MTWLHPSYYVSVEFFFARVHAYRNCHFDFFYDQPYLQMISSVNIIKAVRLGLLFFCSCFFHVLFSFLFFFL